MPALASHALVLEGPSPPSSPICRALSGPKQAESGPAFQILKRVDSVSGYLGGFTVAAVVDAPPEEVQRFLSSPGAWPGVYQGVAGVEDVEAAAAPASGATEVAFTLRNIVHVLGTRHTPAFRMRAWADAATGQVRFRQLQPSGMIKTMEGVNAVVPLALGADPAAQLERAAQDLLASLGVVPPAGGGGAEAPASTPRPPLASLSASLPALGLAAAPRPQRCIVVLHHKCQTQWLPPGVGRLLRGHLLKAHLQNLEDLLAHFGGGGK